jgi:hypothetical protein
MKALLWSFSCASIVFLSACSGGKEFLDTNSVQGISLPFSNTEQGLNKSFVEAIPVEPESRRPVTTSVWHNINTTNISPLGLALSAAKINIVDNEANNLTGIWINLEAAPENWLEIAKAALSQGRAVVIESASTEVSRDQIAQVTDLLVDISVEADAVLISPNNITNVNQSYTLAQFQSSQFSDLAFYMRNFHNTLY